MRSPRPLVAALLIAACTVGCGGSTPARSTGPEGPPDTGLPVAKRARDVVDRQNQRTAQLEDGTQEGQ